MRNIFLFLLSFTAQFGFSQMIFSTTKHDFGDLENYDNRFVDITITNKTPKQGYILSVRKPAEIVYIQNHALIEKDSSLTLRFQVNPREKGRFSYEIEIYTSDKGEATKLKLTGNLKNLAPQSGNSLTACPDFNSHPAGRKANNFEMQVITIDKITREELSQSSVTMLQNGRAIWESKTDKKGQITKDATIGLAYFYALHAGYFPSEKGAFVSNDRAQIIIELEKKPEPIIVEPPKQEEIVIVSTPQPEVVPETQNETTALELELEQETTTSSIELPPALEELDNENFDNSYFKPINIVFVLDVSSSMNQGEKIELMKYSLNQLSDMLRPQDRISIVTYATNTQVLLPTTHGDDKEKIQEEVNRLRANGMTAGGEGIKLGFKQADKGYLSDGVNHVVVITDGAFNRNSDDYKKYIKKYEKKGIKMSVVGVKNQEKDEQAMRDAANLGGGSYIPIFKLADAQKNLKQAVRVLTFR